MARRELRAAYDEVVLSGWVRDGDDRRILVLHGGPGISYGYLDDLVEELSGHTVAAYQQRGLAPSSEHGPFDVATQVKDVVRVLDALGWSRSTLLGHSWGGHLALHVAVAAPDRVSAALCIDTLGGVGDGGSAEFEAEIFRRTPEDVRRRAEELDARAMRGEGTEEDALLALRLVWPAYFPTWDSAPPMPPIRLSVDGYGETLASVEAELPRLEAALPSISAPVGFLVGSSSPMPRSAATDTAACIRGAWVQVAPHAGHLPWLDAPGCVRSAMERLQEGPLRMG